MNKILLLGAVLGLSSLIMGAYIDHGLSAHLTGKELQSLLTASRYHQLYAVIISMIGFLISFIKGGNIITVAGYLFITGILFFSFGIYVATIFNLPEIMRIVPLGGFILMVGWCCLIVASLSKQTKKEIK